MFKYTCLALALAPAVCMTAQANPEVTATTTIRAAIGNLASVASQSQTKDLPAVISEIDALLSRSTPEILSTLEPLTDEQRVAVITALMQAPEIAQLMGSLEPLMASPAAAELMPVMAGEADPAAMAAAQPMKTKLQFIDICANLLKISIALGVDSPTVQAAIGGMFGAE